MTRGEKNSFECVKKAMAKTNMTSQEFFKRAFEHAVRAKTVSRDLDLKAELENFRRLEKGRRIKIPHEISRGIVAYAEEINREEDFKANYGHLPRDVQTARYASGRIG